jgi:hypothetical protein
MLSEAKHLVFRFFTLPSTVSSGRTVGLRMTKGREAIWETAPLIAEALEYMF